MTTKTIIRPMDMLGRSTTCGKSWDIGGSRRQIVEKISNFGMLTGSASTGATI